jgi:hypothetical protein
MTDFRKLCARMADELDHYRQLLMDDRRETHALATEARAALAEGDGVEVTDEEAIARIVYERALRASAFEEVQRFWPRWEDLPDSQARDCAFNAARAVLASYATTHPRPIPVAELVEAATELAELMQGVIDGDYKPDSFTLQPIKAALARVCPAAGQRRLAACLAQREEILAAFIAKHGFHPDEAVQIEQRQANGTITWRIERRASEVEP